MNATLITHPCIPSTTTFRHRRCFSFRIALQPILSHRVISRFHPRYIMTTKYHSDVARVSNVVALRSEISLSRQLCNLPLVSLKSISPLSLSLSVCLSFSQPTSNQHRSFKMVELDRGDIEASVETRSVAIALLRLIKVHRPDVVSVFEPAGGFKRRRERNSARWFIEPDRLMWVVVILDRVYFTVQTVHQIILMRLLFGQREDFIRYVILSYSNGFRWIFASRGTIYSGLIALCSVSSGMDGSTTLLIINSTTFLSLSLSLLLLQ